MPLRTKTTFAPLALAALLGALAAAAACSGGSATRDQTSSLDGAAGEGGGGANAGGAAGGPAAGAAGSIDVGTVGGAAGSSAQGGQNAGGAKPAVGCGAVVTGTVRDFRAGGDFQCDNSGFVDAAKKDCGPWDPSIVGALGAKIGPKRKPVYAGGGKTPSTTGAEAFGRWFTDVEGVNAASPLELTLTAGEQGTFSLDTNVFFPIDGKLFAATVGDPDDGPYKSDDGKVRNFHFTYELHTTFRYDAGNVFTFRGDDDVFVYVNDRLVVNLGGIHVPMQGKIFLDTGRVELTVDPQWSSLVKLAPRPELGLPETIENGVAGTVELGLKAGETYPFDFFFAERNCCGSNFRLESNLVLIDCGVEIK